MKKFRLLGLLLVSLNAFANLQSVPQKNTYQHTTQSGLQYNVIKQGSGKKPSINDEVEIRFVSYDSKGEVLDGTLNNVPIILPIETAFVGLQQALLLMPAGSIYEVYVPPHIGYTEEGKTGKQAITYRIELLRINP